MTARILAVMMAGAAAAVACGSSTTDSGSTGAGAQSSSSTASSSASSSSSSNAAVGGGNGQLTLSGALTGTISGNVQCVVITGNIHNITFAGTAADGSSVRITATDDSGGKGVVTSSATGKNYVFGGTGKITVDATSATFAGASFDVYGGAGSVIVNGKVSCSF
jgi:hypothetical protein